MGKAVETRQFVANFVLLKQQLLDLFVDEKNASEVSALIERLDLSVHQKQQLRNIVDSILRDTIYTILLGLDGVASVGNNQQTYTLLDESGVPAYASGQLESEAWEQFQNVA